MHLSYLFVNKSIKLLSIKNLNTGSQMVYKDTSRPKTGRLV